MRLIAATHRNLETWSKEGKYRPDLYYRLSVFTIRLPALRERGDDLPMLVNDYVRRFNLELAREIREVTPEAMERLRDYPWPGNVRELQSILKQAMLSAAGPVLVPTFLPEKLLGSPEPAATTETSDVFSRLEARIRQGLDHGGEDLYQEAHLELDRFLVQLVLRATDGNQVQTARVLGISRQTLRFKIRELGLTITKSVSEDDGDSDGD